MSNNYRYFCNDKCEYFPCHATDDPGNFNCLFWLLPIIRVRQKMRRQLRIHGQRHKGLFKLHDTAPARKLRQDYFTVRGDYGDDSGEGRGVTGGTCSFFLEKKKEPKKNRFCLSFVLVAFYSCAGVTVFFMREAACGYGFKRISRAMSQRPFLCSIPFVAPALRYLERFGIPRIGVACLDSLRPRLGSPPRKRGGSGVSRGAARA